MSLAVLGLSHHTAPIEVRERLVFPPTDVAPALQRLVAEARLGEAVLLSTCNRTELYFRVDGEADAPPQVVSMLAARAGLPESEVAGYLYCHRDLQAVRHLFRVVAGLDSLVLGEAQIQGQVRTAYELAVNAASGRSLVGPVLSRLFQSALGAGGRVRSETLVGVGAASVPSAAVELAKKIFGSLRGRRAIVLGAGEMGELAMECLAAEGVRNVVVANRSAERAREVAARLGARAASFDDLATLLADTDIVAAATAAPHPVLTREILARALPNGPRGPLLIIDIALPRDVEPAVGELNNVFLYDIDDLKQIVEDNLERRQGEVAAADRILTLAVEDYWSWLSSLEVVPVIRALRGHVEALRQAEVERMLRKLPQLGPEEREAVELLTRQLLNKVLHQPTVRLREAAAGEHGVAVLEAARYLFDLEPGPNGSSPSTEQK
jgi:glutamyl-tRNA reductase